jgi:hypothetical protein
VSSPGRKAFPRPQVRALLIAAGLLLAACSVGHPESTGTATSATMPVPPPAASGTDNTVSVTMALADSFDVVPDGKCAGRSDNAGMSDGARVQLRGDTDGGNVWATATADFENKGPQIYDGVKGHWLYDDGLYCIVKAVFAPTTPDPKSSYSIKFIGGDWLDFVQVGRAPYGQLDRPGYGTAQITIQTCRSLLDPPDKDCPEWGTEEQLSRPVDRLVSARSNRGRAFWPWSGDSPVPLNTWVSRC